jgi:hypothetical protein
MVSRFDEELPARSSRSPFRGMRPGPCAMGPVADGDTLTSMHVWLFQLTDTGMAIASGDVRERQPAAGSRKRRWRVRTGMDPESEEFSTDKPCAAMAMALVEHRDGTQDVKHWAQAVRISSGRTDRGD